MSFEGTPYERKRIDMAEGYVPPHLCDFCDHCLCNSCRVDPESGKRIRTVDGRWLCWKCFVVETRYDGETCGDWTPFPREEPMQATVTTPTETLTEMFQRESKEVIEMAKGHTRIAGFALVVVFDDGRSLRTATTMERHHGGVADKELREGVDDILDQLK